MPDCSNPCGGKCCECFPFSMRAERLGQLYLEAKTYDLSGDDPASKHWRDIITIAEMLIPLHQESDEQPMYTCRHLDRSTGLCTIYEQRPKMCREYPYEGACEQ